MTEIEGLQKQRDELEAELKRVFLLHYSLIIMKDQSAHIIYFQILFVEIFSSLFSYLFQASRCYFVQNFLEGCIMPAT